MTYGAEKRDSMISTERGGEMPKTRNRIEVKDGSLFARILDKDNRADMANAHAFRYKIFLEELAWSSLNSNGEDLDRYDQNSVHFGAFSELGKLIGYCRVVLPKSGFMVENEFADLAAPGYIIRKEEDTVEVSRFAVAKHLRGTKEGLKAIALLVRSLYLWARVNKVRYMYAVCSSDYLEFLRGFLSCLKPIGPTYEYQPGISSSAFILDLEELDLEKVKELWAVLTGKC